ncbi:MULTISPECIES: LamG-like jellyroll fold domain-containing protein [unclassified Carboxylicivirga]|uniref:LamG-like jellyroll fold domain-containing protein n=1 Tax=Carboxylicivirga TaxID=1628153 RepID=UPI003D32914D
MKMIWISTMLILLLGVIPAKAQHEKSLPKLYQQLLDEGWHRKEIDQLMQSYLQEVSGLPSKKDLPGTPLPKPNPQLLENVAQVHLWANRYRQAYETFTSSFPDADQTSGMVNADKIEPNQAIKRQRGLWKHVDMYATAGRIYDLELHPDNEKVMYANPDGDGIFKTEDGGFTWQVITDNIPDRLHRDAYENIIVDPADFDHVFSISRFGNLYETKDGGAHWQQLKNSLHAEGRAPQFKWVEAFRNESNDLIIIGSVTKKSGLNHGWEPGIYRSDDQGQAWSKVAIQGDKFQEMAFHKTQKELIYLANQSMLFKSDNGGVSFKLMHDFEFGNRPMFISTLIGNQADALYVALSQGNDTRVYFSGDQGQSWELRQDSQQKIGTDFGIFGKSGSSGWTSFFEVDPFDANHLIASNVGSCESFDGGRTWEYQAWSTRALAQMPDGSRQLAPHGSHNADNHVLKFHPKKKGFKVKGCDAGIMMKEQADTNWVNINGNMPAFLWYSLVVNEFGDRYIAGNTQDVNIQTYRYNTWENDRGYEGDAIFMNPSTNTTYYPVAKTEPGEGLNFLEPGFWKMHSWSYPKVAVNYQNMDQVYIAYGRRPTEPERQLPKYLYVSDNRGVSFRRVPNMNDKEVFSINVSRTEKPLLTAFTATDVMISDDEGETWQTNAYPEGFKGTQHKRRVSGCVDPDKPQQIWLGGANGAVYQSADGGQSWASIKGSLPDGHVIELLYHEGTAGDLYALVQGYGVFYKAAEASDWQLWMKGFNLADFTEIRIDYPTQKLLAASYGRGLWEADLEKTVDRFFAQRQPLIKALGKINGKHAFALDAPWQLPAFYNFNWLLNGEKQGSNARVLLLDRVKAGDELQLELSPVYATDVRITAQHQVSKPVKNKVNFEKEHSLFLKDQFIDLGYVDYFGASQDFTFSTWIKPITEGLVAANRRIFYRDAKGWYLEVTKDGALHFNAAFYQNRSLDKTFNQAADQALVLSTEKGLIEFNQWAQITVTVRRDKALDIYVNNKLVASQSLADMPADLSLSNVMNLTMLADSYGKKRMIAEVKNMAIYSKALQLDDIRRAAAKGARHADHLTFYIDFNSGSNNSELYTGRKIRLKGSAYLQGKAR